MPPRIALFANKDSAQIAEIAQAVTAAGADSVVLDLRIGPAGGPTLVLSGDDACWGGVDFADIRSLHIRCTTPRTLPTLPALLNDASHAEYRAGFLREQAFQAATYAFFDHQAARGKLVVNPLTGAYVDHESKSQLFEKLRSAGFRVPLSLTTNCPETAARFVDRVGTAVVKQMGGIGSTRIVTAAERDRLDELRRCPTLFQERVVGPTLRIHIVGDRMVLALRVLADDVDSRTHTKGFEPVTLDAGEAAAIVRANRFLGLHYAAWDAIQGDDGRLTYLDCNPGPFMMWLPEAFRRAVFAQLARYLVGFARTGSLEAASAAVLPGPEA